MKEELKTKLIAELHNDIDALDEMYGRLQAFGAENVILRPVLVAREQLHMEHRKLVNRKHGH